MEKIKEILEIKSCLFNLKQSLMRAIHDKPVRELDQIICEYERINIKLANKLQSLEQPKESVEGLNKEVQNVLLDLLQLAYENNWNKEQLEFRTVYDTFRIQNLLKEYATQQKSINNWISVKDRLPTSDVLKFIPVLYSSVKTGNVNEGKFNIETNKFQTMEFKDCFSDITHWQPLPQAPTN